MNIKCLFSIVIALCMGFEWSGVHKVQADENPSFEFLRTEFGARAASMGGAFVGMYGDIHSLFYNPGGIAFVQRRNISATYMNNIMDFNVGGGAYIHPLSKFSSIGLGIQYFDYGDFQGKDQFGQDTGIFGANDIAISAGYGKLMRNDFGVGASIKYIQSKIAGYSASAVAGDIGLLYFLRDKQVTVGISAINFGKSTSAFVNTKESLPSQIKFGLTKQLSHLPLLLSGEIRKFIDDDLYFHGGGEFQFRNSIKIRFGYSSTGSDQKLGIDSDRWSGFSFGAGILIKQIILDYSLSSLGGIGSQNRFTFSAFF
ncbi:MAG: PorV/PorQ family protein [Promethearchaeota archaeon]